MRIAGWLVALSACGAGTDPRATTGGLSGGVRDHDAGKPVAFTLDLTDPIQVEYGDPAATAIRRYRLPRLPSSLAIIEGTVNDTQTNERVAGTVISAVRNEDREHANQMVTDDHGRFRFDQVAPGTYVVSAYYSVSGRGQFEVRRSEIDVAGAEAVIVPLWIEMAR